MSWAWFEPPQVPVRISGVTVVRSGFGVPMVGSALVRVHGRSVPSPRLTPPPGTHWSPLRLPR